jgi:hypothetical protein
MNVKKYFFANPWRYSCTKFDFSQIISGKSELSVDYTAERPAFQGIILGKSKLSADYTAERHGFPRYNPQKGM